MNGRRHHLYEPYIVFERFEEAEQLFNNCAYEGFFDPPRGYPDCDLCPVKEECLKFWDNYVIVEPLRPKQKERYLSIVARKARALKRRKRERRLVCEALTKMAQGS